jgi:hypothetical protein
MDKVKIKETKGVKHDSDKPTLAYIPKAGIWAEGKAFAFGAKKYDSWNYKNGLDVIRTCSAAIRHIFQFLDGQDKDICDETCETECAKHSQVHHLGCAKANLSMALDTLENHPEFDTRHKRNK